MRWVTECSRSGTPRRSPRRTPSCTARSAARGRRASPGRWSAGARAAVQGDLAAVHGDLLDRRRRDAPLASSPPPARRRTRRTSRRRAAPRAAAGTRAGAGHRNRWCRPHRATPNMPRRARPVTIGRAAVLGGLQRDCAWPAGRARCPARRAPHWRTRRPSGSCSRRRAVVSAVSHRTHFFFAYLTERQIIGVRSPLAARSAGAGRTERLVGDLGVDLQDRVDQHLGPGRAAGQVHVHRHHVVDALHHGVVVEHPAGRGAHAHREHPARLGHLVVDLAQHRRHLVGSPGPPRSSGRPGRGEARKTSMPKRAEVVARGRRSSSSRSRSTPGRTWPATATTCGSS